MVPSISENYICTAELAPNLKSGNSVLVNSKTSLILSDFFFFSIQVSCSKGRGKKAECFGFIGWTLLINNQHEKLTCFFSKGNGVKETRRMLVNAKKLNK